MRKMITSFKALKGEKLELEKKLLEVQQKMDAQAKDLRSARVAVLGEAILAGLESGKLEKTLLGQLNLGKKDLKLFEEFETKTEAQRPKGWDKVE